MKFTFEFNQVPIGISKFVIGTENAVFRTGWYGKPRFPYPSRVARGLRTEPVRKRPFSVPSPYLCTNAAKLEAITKVIKPNFNH